MVTTNQLSSVNVRKQKVITAAISVAFIAFVVLMMVNPAFAASDYTSDIKKILNNMIGIIGTIFRAVGIILAVYATGSLVLAFKNEDANSKSSASMILVVGVVLVAMPSIINTLNLINYLG